MRLRLSFARTGFAQPQSLFSEHRHPRASRRVIHRRRLARKPVGHLVCWLTLERRNLQSSHEGWRVAYFKPSNARHLHRHAERCADKWPEWRATIPYQRSIHLNIGVLEQMSLAELRERLRTATPRCPSSASFRRRHRNAILSACV